MATTLEKTEQSSNSAEDGSDYDQTLRRTYPCPIHTEHDLVFYCNDCSTNICFQCGKNSHNAHHWIEYSHCADPALLQGEKCLIHSTMRENYFCLDCDKFVCFVCGQENHLHHEWTEERRYATKIWEILRSEKQYFDSVLLPKMKENRDRLQNILKENKESFKSNMGRLEKIRSVLHAEVDLLIDEVKAPYIDRNAQCIKELKEMECQIEGNIKTLRQMMDMSNRSTKTVIQCYQQSQAIKQSSEMNTTSERLCDRTQYISGKVDRNRLRSMIGEFVDSSRVEVGQPILQFETKKPVSQIVPVGSDRAWVCSKGEKKADMVFYKTGRSEARKLPFDCQSLLMVDENCGFMSDFRNMCINRIDFNCRKIACKFKPVSLTASNIPDRIVLTFVTDRSSHQGIVSVYSYTGLVLNEMRLDADGKPLFNEPLKAIENITGDICVLDRNGRYSSRLILLNKEGHVRWEYRRNIPKSFICDLAFDKYNNIVCVDDENNCIFIISWSGVYIKDILPITKPTAIAIQNSTMWVGQNCGKIQAFPLLY